MLYRKYVGSIVFYNEKVFLIQNEKSEWILPRIKVNDFGHSDDFYSQEFHSTYKLNIKIKKYVGDSIYEFYSISKKSPMCNTVIWYQCIVEKNSYMLTKVKGHENAGFYSIKEALEKITYTQEQKIIKEACKLLVLNNTDSNIREDVFSGDEISHSFKRSL